MLKLSTPLTQTDSTPQFTYGSRTSTKDGNEYIYMPGVASCAQYDWVIFNESSMSYGSVTRLPAAGGAGAIGIAQAAITGALSGWFQIKGVGWGKCGQSASSGSTLYSSGTTGQVTAVAVTNNAIAGAFAAGTGVSGGTVKVIINYPWKSDTLD